MKKVFFVCVGNSARSQMAEAFFNHLAQGKAQASSAGTSPAGQVAPLAVEVMNEVDIDMSHQYPKPLTQDMMEEADRIISMGCGVKETCPVSLGAKIDEDWGIDDPFGKPEEMREIRDEIRRRVKLLLEQLGIPHSSE
ncbi:MAG: arsenate reductase ArsC [Armatimonadetes bacterium]|nr:arsenate reductase ArsC [Armatimonadota bacterium]NIM23903.1 arsenate reductase ArsC [Armatimonadota bacterium]NIM66622.1 arsenate reductase ArsC [Armatimonadota bacterium]NIM76290.1 arsenate reductase ArsC [Armatimonadota bacterium]NIN05984.1 arsenate reductase ArsC [Armatimonadota bacterium]